MPFCLSVQLSRSVHGRLSRSCFCSFSHPQSCCTDECTHKCDRLWLTVFKKKKEKKKCSLTSFLPIISLTFSRVFVWRHKRERGTDWRSRVFNKSLWVMTSADTITYHLISQLLNKNVKLFSFHTLKSFRVSYISIEYYCILDYWPDKMSSWTLGSLW